MFFSSTVGAHLNTVGFRGIIVGVGHLIVIFVLRDFRVYERLTLFDFFLQHLP